MVHIKKFTLGDDWVPKKLGTNDVGQCVGLNIMDMMMMVVVVMIVIVEETENEAACSSKL